MTWRAPSESLSILWPEKPGPRSASAERRKLSASSGDQKHKFGTVRRHHSFISQANSPRLHGHQIYVRKRKQLPGNSYNGGESAAHLHILLYCLPDSTSDCPRIQRRSPPPAGSTGGRLARSRLDTPHAVLWTPTACPLPAVLGIPGTLKGERKGKSLT